MISMSYNRKVRRLHIIAVICIFVIIYNFYRLLLIPAETDLIENLPQQCAQLCRSTSHFTNDRLRFDTSSVRHFPDFVCPQNFRNLADWVFGWPNQFFEYVDSSQNNITVLAPCLLPGSIIYSRIAPINKFFDEIYPHLIHNFVLITGDGDQPSPNDISYLNRPDSKIIHWFGQNGAIEAGAHPKFTHIPIGINCYEMADAIRLVQKQTSSKQYFLRLYNDSDEPTNYILLSDMTERVLSPKGIDREHLALINFDPGTDGTGLRSRVWKNMCNSNKTKSFVTCLTKSPGVQIFRIQLIYPRNRKYAFWISPRGNGMDCHRTWEALYLDIIPIVWNSTLNSLYTDLPIVIINDESEITEEFLRDQLKVIALKKQESWNSPSTNRYRYEKLRHAYWRQQILSKSRYATRLSDLGPRRRCWRAEISFLEWSRYIPFLKYF